MLDLKVIKHLVAIAQLPVVELTKEEFEEMGEYSCTQPTGVYNGKRWKRDENAYNPYNGRSAWLMGEYAPSPSAPDTHCVTKWSRIALV